MWVTLEIPRTRGLVPADVAALAELAQRLGGSETEEQWRAFLARKGAFGLGALAASGRIVGYAAGEIRTDFGSRPAGWVEAFGVDLAHRGSGTGRHLLGELLAAFRSAGATHAYTLVPMHDQVLGPFFRQFGFRDEPLHCLGVSL